MNTPTPSAACPKCGRPIPPEAREELCPSCALAAVAAPTDAGLPPESQPSPPTREAVAAALPQFDILELVGRGGMGSVFKARQPQLNRVVALKILPNDPARDPKFAERFLREAQALARLDHPNIVTVHDSGEAGGFLYLVMEYVDGASLRQLLRERRLQPEEALAIVPRICEALQFAHEQGVVHRDIKPENVLIDRHGRVKIADFGIAKLVSADEPRAALTEESCVIGTPHYMAPEQIERPRLVDHRADIYSLGVVFYEMLTGELPLGKFPPPSRKVQLDVRLDEVVLRSLEKEPERRYQQASEVKNDVETIAVTSHANERKERSSLPEASTSRSHAWEVASIAVGTVFFLIMLSVVVELTRANRLPVGQSLLVIACLGLGICVLSAIGWWPFPSPLFPEPNFSSRNLRRWSSTRHAHGAAKPDLAKPPSLGPVIAARWTARILGTLSILLVLPFILAEGLPPIALQPEGVQLTFIGGFLLFLGFVLGWWREGTAAVLIACGWTVVRISESTFHLVTWFELTLVVAALYAFCWWATRGRPTRIVITTTTVLAATLAFGRLFVPTSVFLAGTVTDQVSGQPLSNAELHLPPHTPGTSPDDDPPQARTDARGHFRLYIGWYSANRSLSISAPGYLTLTTNLGPRDLGRRSLPRDFSLQPEFTPPDPPFAVAKPGEFTLTVASDGRGTHASIQATLDAAPTNAVIRVAPGRYAERLLITHSVTLVGANWNTTVIGPLTPTSGPTPADLQELERRLREAATDEERTRLRLEAQERFFKPVVRIANGASVQFENLKLTQPGSAPDGRLLEATVVEVRDGTVSFRDCAIVGSPGNGLILRDGAKAHLTHTLVAAAWNTGIRVERGARAQLTITDSDIRNCHYAGVVIGRGQDHVHLERCRISGAAWHGVRYDSASPTVADCLIFANARSGIYASGSSTAQVHGNVLWKNEMNGMSCWFANRDSISNNTFAANLREGLSVLGTSAPLIARNIFWQNPQGIYQGNIGSEAANAKASAPLRLQTNLFWTNTVHIASTLGATVNDASAPPSLPLEHFPGNVELDPGFRDSAVGDFSLPPQTPAAAAAGIGAPRALQPNSPFPLQPEESAIIPETDTRDSRQWKRPR